LVYAALLGVVQGLTEFLPISSSAHLFLARAFFGWDAEAFGLAFDVACHVGTLLAVVAFFWRELAEMVLVAPRLFGAAPAARRARLIVIGTVPVVIVGLLLADVIEQRLRTPGVCAMALTIGALALLVAERLGPRPRRDDDVRAGEAFGLGWAQASALLPGVSRSGATIAVGMFMGLQRDAAARFSFVLGVPAILAAAGKEGVGLLRQGLGGEAAALFAVGMVTSALVGYFTIKYFLRFLVSHRLDAFAYYRLALAAAVGAWLLAR
jgi:undecaprenyl-diphosphatase